MDKTNNIKNLIKKDGTYIENGVLFIGEDVKKIMEEEFSNKGLYKGNPPYCLEFIGERAFPSFPNLTMISYKGKEYYFKEGINDIQMINDDLLILYNHSFCLALINANGNIQEIKPDETDKYINYLSNGEEARNNIERYNEWVNALTTKNGVIDKGILKQIPAEIMLSLSGTLEHVNQIKQGINKYLKLKEHFDLTYINNVSLFKVSYVLGLFDGDKEHSDDIYNYLLDQYHWIKLNSDIDNIDLEKGYNKYISKLLYSVLKYSCYKGKYYNISRIYNEYDNIKKFSLKVFKRDVYPKIHKLVKKEKLTNEELEYIMKYKNKYNRSFELEIDDIDYYFSNYSLTSSLIRPGNEELYNIIPYIDGMSHNDLEYIQDIYEKARGVKKKIVQTIDKSNSDYTYEWSPSDNPYNVVLGYIVDCCAKFKYEAEDIMIQSMINPEIQNLLILDKEKSIVGKATAYYNEKDSYILFNNVEISEYFQNTVLYEEKNMARLAIKRAVIDQIEAQKNSGIQINEVRMGMNRNDLFCENEIETEVPFDFKIEKSNLLLNYPYKDYEGDANYFKFGQGILYEYKIKEPIKVKRK